MAPRQERQRGVQALDRLDEGSLKDFPSLSALRSHQSAWNSVPLPWVWHMAAQHLDGCVRSRHAPGCVCDRGGGQLRTRGGCGEGGQIVGTLRDSDFHSEVRVQPLEGVDCKRITVVWRVLWGARQGGRRWGHGGSGTGQRLDSG